MASVIAYYRPRGIQGNYKVGLLLDLKRTEETQVFRYTHKPSPSQSLQERLRTTENGERSISIDELGKYQEPDKIKLMPVRTIAKASLFKKIESRIETFILSHFNYYPEREFFIIKITDKEIAGEQRTIYEAKENEIHEQEESTVDRFRSRFGTVRANLHLNQITLVDLDIPNNPLIQQYRSEIKQLRQYIEG